MSFSTDLSSDDEEHETEAQTPIANVPEQHSEDRLAPTRLL